MSGGATATNRRVGTTEKSVAGRIQNLAMASNRRQKKSSAPTLPEKYSRHRVGNSQTTLRCGNGRSFQRIGHSGLVQIQRAKTWTKAGQQQLSRQVLFLGISGLGDTKEWKLSSLASGTFLRNSGRIAT